MSIKEKFVKMVEDLLVEVEVYLEGDFEVDEEALAYFEKFKVKPESKSKSVEMTENGKNIIEYMQGTHEEVHNLYKSKDIAEGMFVSSRSVSGAMRKLVTDGYVDKSEDSPIVYSLTEDGKTYSI